MARPVRTLSVEEARSVYDRIGAWQDTQAFYEDRALRTMILRGAFEGASSIVEFGCGTGSLAGRLLREHLSPVARYVALDQSPVMLDLARIRLAPLSPRAEVRATDGSIALPFPDGSFDRFVTAYVLDLLADDAARGLLAEAHRVLRPEGRACIISLTDGRTFGSRAVTRLWRLLFSVFPRLVGGCRPIQVTPLLEPGRWDILQDEVVSSWGVPSEVVTAVPR